MPSFVIDKAITKFEHSNKTGYPYGLSEEQVIRMIYFFGGRRAAKLATGYSSQVKEFIHADRLFFETACGWFGFVCNSLEEKQKAYRAIITRFKSIIDFLKARPAYITMQMYKALDVAGYKNVTRNVLTVIDENGRISLKVSDNGKKLPPIGKLETEMWLFQSITFDKLKMIVQSIEPRDIQKANLGTKSKALRDLYSVIHMARLSNKVPNLTLMNINIGSSGSKEKVLAYSAYINKNRESN